MDSILSEMLSYVSGMGGLELVGLIFGLLAVIFLVKARIITWPFGIAYVLVSFVIFWQARLYGDFILHIIFLILNIYGWYEWVHGKSEKIGEYPITHSDTKTSVIQLVCSIIGIWIFAKFLIWLPTQFEGMEAASLPYWDSTTSVLSITGMWLTAKKRIDNWYYWFVVDVLATGIYFHKGIYFYALLYGIYISFAVWGYLTWRKLQQQQLAIL
ncbi:MAG: nicotinamide riboside transporter PnuC [Bacteroidia bacterium]|nr:nicotinamide riboside transporter PnuC [Bacteroidia bacterium]